MLIAEDVIEKLTIEDMVDIIKLNGGGEPKPDSDGNLYFRTICHHGKDGDGKQKLHLFIDSKFFMCYTGCGSLSIFDVLMGANDWTFEDAFYYVAKYKNLNVKFRHKGLKFRKIENLDLEFLDRHLYIPRQRQISLPSYDKKILNVFSGYYPDVWEKEGINPDTMQHFGVCFDFNQYKAIIPHFDEKGNLVGIRGRNFYKNQIEAGKKYIPITIQGLTYRYPKNFNLYGLYQNKSNIKTYQRAILFESEKSVMKYGSYFGQENNIALSIMGMTISIYQRDLMLKQGIKEVIIALDKQYEIEYINDENTKQYKEFVKYVRQLKKIVSMFINYCNVTLILCWDDRLDYKDSPVDSGKEIFEELMQERYSINDVEELDELL